MDYGDRQMIDEFNSAVSILRSLYHDGLLIELSKIGAISNDPTINKLIGAIRELSEMERTGLLSKLSNLNEVADRLSHASNSYEINELTRAINNLNSAMKSGNIATLRQFADSLTPENLSVIDAFVRTLKERGNFEIQGLSSFEATAAQLSNQVSTLGSYIQKLEKEIDEMRKPNLDMRLRNYLDILRDEELMKNLGLTKEMVAKSIADELNKLGLPASYLVSIMSSETDTKSKGK